MHNDDPKLLDKYSSANCVDPDQTAPLSLLLSASLLFAIQSAVL